MMIIKHTLKYLRSVAALLLLSSCGTPDPTHPVASSDGELAVNVKSKQEKKKAEVAKIPTITPQEEKNLWVRVGRQLHIPVTEQKKVIYYRNFYLKHQRYLAAISNRARPFLYLIVDKIESRNLPMELALLPIVESSFDAFAYSFGSAAGLWQFISSTGKIYGLKQNFWYDGRRDVDAATDAALDYMTYLGRKFHGDWYHAIASYNSGSGRVASAIRRNKKAKKQTDFFSLDLPQETRDYVPKLLALADIIAHPKKYKLHLPPIENKQLLVKIDPKEQLDLAIAAQYAGLSTRTLHSYNPAYNQWATSPDGPYHFLIPVEKAALFKKNMLKNRGKGVKLIRYKIKSGDSISVLAQKYRTTAEVIRIANGLKDNQLRMGHYLMIPTSTKGDKHYALSAANRLAHKQSIARGQYKITHIVKSNESLWTIARKYDVHVSSLARWNGMAPKDMLKRGKKLVIWKKGKKGAVVRSVYYHVKNGDTLGGIAAKFKVRVNDIIKWNHLEHKKYLKPGQKLTMHVDVTKVSSH